MLVKYTVIINFTIITSNSWQSNNKKMKNNIIVVIFLIIAYTGHTQQIFNLRFDSFQQVSPQTGGSPIALNLPKNDFTVVMGGLNDMDGMNNYLNLFGSKLIIYKMESYPGGARHVVLRREDGLDFFNLYPTITAKLTPIHYQKD